MAKHILVIDDQESMRNIVAQMLRNEGYQVSEADNGQAGLRLFVQNKYAFDLILADVNMPKIDGFEFLKKVKTLSPNSPVIFLTGINEEVAKTVGTEYKVDGIIKKPFVVEEALAVIQKALG
ncbi:response regulator transcription factor [Candidatus Margulisiibacteriota bacterium]